MNKYTLTILLITIICTGSHSQTLTTIEYLNKMQSLNIPFFESKASTRMVRGFNYRGDSQRVIPYCTYSKMTLTSCITETNKSVLRKFNQTNSAYKLITIVVGESDFETLYIATMNNSGEIIDYIESGVFFYTSSKIYIKQYSISSDMKITVYWLKVTSPTIADPLNFSSVTAQRIDRKYQINATGYFSIVQEKFYQPKTYTKPYLEDKTKNIWDGVETLLP